MFLYHIHDLEFCVFSSPSKIKIIETVFTCHVPCTGSELIAANLEQGPKYVTSKCIERVLLKSVFFIANLEQVLEFV